MKLFFVTGNEIKHNEARAYFPDIEGIKLDLPEIQSLSPLAVLIEKITPIFDSKLAENIEIDGGGFIVDDFCAGLECQNGFPGTMVKWFEKSFDDSGAAEFNNICRLHNNNKATITISIGWTNRNRVQTFTNKLDGTIVHPRPGVGKGIYTVFMPNGSEKTLSQMTDDEGNTISPRGKCFAELKSFLDTKL
jgi:non-canonical purine NTP pyrophosphatase (RdgB/HAM1 family)